MFSNIFFPIYFLTLGMSLFVVFGLSYFISYFFSYISYFSPRQTYQIISGDNTFSCLYACANILVHLRCINFRGYLFLRVKRNCISQVLILVNWSYFEFSRELIYAVVILLTLQSTRNLLKWAIWVIKTNILTKLAFSY